MARRTRGNGKEKLNGDKELVDGNAEDVEIIEGGGFMVEKKKRKTRARNNNNNNNNSAVDEISAESSGELISTRKRSKPQKKASTIKKTRGSRKKADKINYAESDDEDNNNDSEEYVPDKDENEEEEEDAKIDKEEVIEVTNGSAADNDDDDDDDDNVPVARRAAKTKKKPKRERKPRKKIDYFKLITNKLYTNHDGLENVFSDLKNTPVIETKEAPHPIGMTLQMLPFQLEGLNWLVKQEDSGFEGGVLADEMGMGKTIQTIGLFMADPKKGPNLVVVPPVAIMQWKNEIETHTAKALKVYVFHGASRTSNSAELEGYDVILTTYSVLESVWRKQQYGFKRTTGLVKEKSVLHSIEFYRVVLDEAHSIKDRQSGTAKSVNNLKCKKKWCLSGTPLQNRIGELYSLIRFLKVQPFCNYYCTKCPCTSMEWNFIGNRYCADCGHLPMQHTNFFNHFFLKNIIKYGIADAEGNVSAENEEKIEAFSLEKAGTEITDNLANRGVEAFGLLQLLLSKIMLRRTKTQRADDLGLPPKTIEVRYDLFNPEEKDLYHSLYSDSNRQFNDYVEEGVVLNNYANIFTLITRMRQMADHPDLVLKKMNNAALNGYEGIVCQLCDDEAEDAIQSKCNHKFCRLCISEYVKSFDSDDADKKLECPVCHIGLSIDLDAPALEVSEELESRGNKGTSIVNKINIAAGRWKSSTKIEAVVEELYKSRSQNHTIKTIIYSQFTSFLDLVDWRLRRAGFKTVRMQGSMSPQQRASTIDHFMNNVNVEVFLVSLKAGGVSLNLTESSQIFIMDPWWHLAAEEQADRVHRIKQTRPVRIVKFCIADSIEKKIMELQDKKADMVKATIEGDQGSASRLTPADLQFLFSH